MPFEISHYWQTCHSFPWTTQTEVTPKRYIRGSKLLKKNTRNIVIYLKKQLKQI
jgi:hypothetical protein